MTRTVRSHSDLETVLNLKSMLSHTRMGVCFMLLTPVNRQ
jgi:hypothetical protein